MQTKNIVIFVSGRGSNAEKIIQYFKEDERVEIPLLVSNKKEAKALDMARSYGIDTHVVSRKELREGGEIKTLLKTYHTDLIVLAGFLWLIPAWLVEAFPNKILNIHPALLPDFGGKGMYGMNVHRAVKESGMKESGITIHYVNENYDEGNIIFQTHCDVNIEDRAEDIAGNVLKLEHAYYPKIIEKVLFDKKEKSIQ